MTNTEDWRAGQRIELRAALQQRRAFRQSAASPFVRAMLDAMGEYRRMRSEGVSRDDAVRGIEAVLREMWPRPVSKFQPSCPDCEDVGLLERTCQLGSRCGRQACAHRPSDLAHVYGVPCHCPAGDRFRGKVPTETEAIAAVGKTRSRKRSGWSPVGA